jgi:hypothetical protein
LAWLSILSYRLYSPATPASSAVIPLPYPFTHPPPHLSLPFSLVPAHHHSRDIVTRAPTERGGYQQVRRLADIRLGGPPWAWAPPMAVLGAHLPFPTNHRVDQQHRLLVPAHPHTHSTAQHTDGLSGRVTLHTYWLYVIW